MSSRPAIPKGIREGVLDEYNHLCAICGKPQPQMHHIDGDPSNNDPMNLLPLCPNHHFTDQHNPTRKIDPGLILLFRRFKDPAILSPQFEPLFERLRFLERLDDESLATKALTTPVKDLVAFVGALQMGDFYAERIQKLLSQRRIPIAITPGQSQAELKVWFDEKRIAYIRRLKENRDDVIRLVVEQLRYQDWKAPDGI